MNEAFNRFIVFEWDEFDNGYPIPKIQMSFVTLEEAKEKAKSIVEGDLGEASDYSSILDLDSRQVVAEYTRVQENMFAAYLG